MSIQMATHPKKGTLEEPLEALSPLPPERPPGAWGWTEGRPSSYPHHRPKALQLAEQGATLEELSVELKLTIRTLSRWRHSHPDFADALDRGRAKRSTGQDARTLGRKAAALERDRAEQIAKDARVAAGAAALQEMLKGYKLPPAAAASTAPAEPARERRPAPATRAATEPEYRRRSEPAQLDEIDDGDNSPVDWDDPLKDW